MLRSFLIITSLLLAFPKLSGQLNAEDYKIYTALIKSEILNTTRSVTIIKRLENDSSSMCGLTKAIKSKDAVQLEQIRFMTRDAHGNNIPSIDTAALNLILDFSQNQDAAATVENLFSLNVRTFLILKSPVKKHSENGWKKFYEKYPGSGGLFTFSNIYYSQDNKTAIFYHSLRRNGLNGHGALTVMENANDGWKIKYQIYSWQA